MRRVLVLENDPGDGPGHLAPALRATGVASTVVRVHAGEPVPSVDAADGFVILGGAMGVYESDAHPWIEDEADLVREAVAAKVPVLGICLGAQLIAHALGGRAFVADAPEVGVVTSRLTVAGERDPLSEFLPGPYLAFHQDTFEVPPDAELLAASSSFPHVFRSGSALAIQSHPEVTVEGATYWGRRSPLPARAGVDYDAVIDEMERAVSPERAIALFSAWIEQDGGGAGEA
ncbi:MAG: type 1 glutamine amidotransferase [Acidimicrobiia bacterium]|nr:type 1 glutamine amidotransferase [Acidimicrobiia bacterium]